MSPRTVVVIGAGIFGVTSALELRSRGWDVALLDPGPVPHPDASSTDVSKAIRMDYGSDDLYMAMGEAAMVGWDAWNDRWDAPLYHESGVLFLSRDAMTPGGFEHESFTRLEKRGHRPERMRGGALEARFPAWAAGRYPDGYFNARGGWAESGRVVAALAAEAKAVGVRIEEGVRFARLAESDSRVVGIVTDRGDTLRADVTLVAAGAWTPHLLPHLHDAIRSVGQPVFHFRPADPAPFAAPRFCVWGADIATTGWYGFPADADGLVKIANHGPGQTVHPAAPRIVGPEWEPRFRTFLRESLPALADAPIATTRLCLYEDSWDGNFWIDHDPDRPGLVVASGGSGHGFKFAPVLGRIVADVVERVPNPYAPRFAWRPPGQPGSEHARHSG